MNSQPYFYQAPDEHIYLIQNVLEGQMNRALYAGKMWEENKVNTGFASPEIDFEVPYVVYGISAASTTVPIENKAGDRLDFLSVLQYNTSNYAAMLRLL